MLDAAVALDVKISGSATSGEGTMSTTGEKPGKGTYTCTNCGETVTLDDHDDTLPPCPRCHQTNYTP